MNTCDHIAHRMAAGERLNQDQLDHVELCTACGASMEATATLGAIGTARAAVMPGPGFSARMASRAWERAGKRRRNRFLGYGFATSGVLAAAAITLVMWTADPRTQMSPQADPAAMQAFMDTDSTSPADDALEVSNQDAEAARDLVWLTDSDRALTQSANWDFIEEPVSPYALLLDEDALEEDKP